MTVELLGLSCGQAPFVFAANLTRRRRMDHQRGQMTRNLLYSTKKAPLLAALLVATAVLSVGAQSSQFAVGPVTAPRRMPVLLALVADSLLNGAQFHIFSAGSARDTAIVALSDIHASPSLAIEAVRTLVTAQLQQPSLESSSALLRGRQLGARVARSYPELDRIFASLQAAPTRVLSGVGNARVVTIYVPRRRPMAVQ